MDNALLQSCVEGVVAWSAVGVDKRWRVELGSSVDDGDVPLAVVDESVVVSAEEGEIG